VVAAAAAVLSVSVASAAPSGALRPVDEVLSASISNAVDVTVAPDGRNVYGLGFASDEIGVFDRNARTGAIEFADLTDGDGLENPEAIVISRDGDNAYVAGEFSDSVHSYERNAEGQLNNIDSDVDGVDGADGLNGAVDVAITRTGTHVYVAGSEDNAIALLARQSDGSLAWQDAFINGLQDITNMVDPSAVAISPDGKNVYVASEGSGAVVTFKRFAATGQLDYVESDAGFFEEAQDVAVSPDGRQVYVAFSDGVRTFRRNAATGALTLLGLTDDPPTEIAGLAVSPDGGNVYGADPIDDGAASFATRRSTALRFLEFDAVSEFTIARAAAVSADGRHVYVAGGTTGDGHIAVFSRQPRLDLRGKRKQAAARLAVKAETSADCRAKLSGKGLESVREALKAGKPERIRLKFKDDPPDSGKVTVKGRAVCGNRSDTDRFKVKLK
jgi:DNA-binding beta-propeller fold protein YncE